MGFHADKPELKRIPLPSIDMKRTGHNIAVLRERKRLSVKDLQSLLGFDSPQAIYKWQRGITLPNVDNLVALSAIFEVPIDEILILEKPPKNRKQVQ